MRDVAALAEVSLATVSRVVNGDARVDAGMAGRVVRAVELLGYRHDVTASSLRRADRVSASIGLVVADVANPFFAAVHRGVEDVARRHGVLVLTGSSDEEASRERELTDAFTSRSIDGLIIAPGMGDHGYLARERALGMQIVCVDRPAPLFDADAVVSDNVGGAHAAVSHLLAHGHRRIAYIGDRPELFTFEQRLAGYRRALGGHDVPDDPALVRHPEPHGVGAERDHARAARRRRSSHRAVHEPEPRHDRRDQGAARPRRAAARRARRVRRRDPRRGRRAPGHGGRPGPARDRDARRRAAVRAARGRTTARRARPSSRSS